MTKQIQFRLSNDSGPLPPVAGELDENGTIVQTGILKNVGTEALTSIKLKVTNEPGLPATLAASVNGVALTGTETEVLSGPLAVGASVAAILTWTAPGTIIEGDDSGTISGSVV